MVHAFLKWAALCGASFVALAPAAFSAPPAPALTQDFRAWRAMFALRAVDAGIGGATLAAALGGLEPDRSILALLDSQPELDRAVWDYLDLIVSDERIMRGRAKLAEHEALLDSIEAAHGVDRHILVAIWGIESTFGDKIGSRGVVRSLATLACCGGRRARYGEEQLLAALRIVERGDQTAADMVGSWAGAMGQTQFIPTTFDAFAVDFDRDGRRDLWTNAADALASTANYLVQSGWQAGEPWGEEATVPRRFDFAATADVHQSSEAWRFLGVRPVLGRSRLQSPRTALLMPVGARGPAFLVTTNFRAILRYNNAVPYALAVGHLADRLAAGPPFSGIWPRDERPLLGPEREELQRLLNRNGYLAGAVDGIVGPATKAAVRAYQQGLGVPADGYPTVELLERLRGAWRS